MRGCILLALFVWPTVMILTDIIGGFIEPYIGIDDLGMAASKFTMPVMWLYAIVLWFRGFIIQERSVNSAFLAVITLPLWFVPTAIITFINFPFGRINPNF